MLATGPASPALLDGKPDKITAPLFSVNMYKQIFSTTPIVHFFDLQILGLQDTSKNDTIVQTVVFNIFVFAQIFDSFNSR